MTTFLLCNVIWTKVKTAIDKGRVCRIQRRSLTEKHAGTDKVSNLKGEKN